MLIPCVSSKSVVLWTHGRVRLEAHLSPWDSVSKDSSCVILCDALSCSTLQSCAFWVLTIVCGGRVTTWLISGMCIWPRMVVSHLLDWTWPSVRIWPMPLLTLTTTSSNSVSQFICMIDSLPFRGHCIQDLGIFIFGSKVGEKDSHFCTRVLCSW